ncbi:DUF3786 domain-containing protein [Aceticella autotrophica]|uniref:DUF3786 domain-containing protein n=1 Tax=Aceticella autotrophica TaxID=2755338 RepID=A0A975GAC5_9THEO|nr:DUF3786 domain-containing protein [Aceticella autotrophica]QSZ27248.1 DUF3786 domain-containing protein [Aceticella autotrophica]
MDRAAIDEKRKDKIPYEYNRELFKKCNPEEIYKRTGCKYNSDSNEFVVKLMGTKYIVKFPSGEILNQDYSEVNNYPLKTLILRYLINSKKVPATNKYITYRDVSGGNVYYNNFYGRCIFRLSRTFGNKLDKFKEALESLGAEKIDMGDAAYKFEFIDNVYLVFAIWSGDEEFSPSAQILFDGNISFYFTAEDLAFVGEIAIAKLKELSNK